jgi:hypothetical protein
MLIWIEFGLVLSAVLLAFCFPEIGSNTFVSAERIFSGLARKQRFSILVVGLASLGARVALLPILPVPEPHINDEFSHLLLADTLAHGRLTNPPHPMWLHFETFHVLMRPTYASMYPPAQGLVLAIGQAIAHQPFAGVCLSVGAMSAAICWMLQGWVSPGWALLGGLLAVIRLGILSYWGNSYWGGALAAIGGALVLGALPRVVRSERVRDALIMGLGLALLANSRPYEGFILSVPVALTLVIWLFREKQPIFWTSVRRVIIPLTLVLTVAGLATGYYFWRVTGSPFRMPQQIDRDTYAVAPYFLWQSPRPEPIYHHVEMHDFYLHNELNFYAGTRSLQAVIAAWIVKVMHGWFFFLGPVLTLPLLMGVANSRYGSSGASADWRRMFLLSACVISVAGLSIEVFFFPHYAAPMTGVIYLLVIIAMRATRAFSWRGKRVGLFLSRAIPLICVMMLALRASAAPLHIPLTPNWPPTWYNCPSVKTERVRIQAQLSGYPGKQLVLVRYRANSQSEYDWVYNEANIDGAKIVWARDMGAAKNQELLSSYADRRMWLMEPDESPPKLSPYRNDAVARANEE